MDYSAYIDVEYYSETYEGITIEDAKFSRMAKRASDEVDKLTVNFVRLNGISKLTATAQEAVKIATCVMAEALYLTDTATGSSGIFVNSESSNGYNYSADKESISTLLIDARVSAWTKLQMGGFNNSVYGVNGLLMDVT